MKKFLKYIDILFFAATLLIIDIIFRLIVDFSLLSIKPLFFNAVTTFFIISIVLFFNKKIRIIIEICIIVIFSIYSFSQAYHFIFFNTVFSLRKITIIKELWGVKETVFSKFDFRLLLFFVPLLFFIILFSICRNIIGNAINKKIYIFASTILILSLICFIFMHFYTNIESSEDIDNEMELYHTISNKNKFVIRYGIYTFAYRDIESIILEGKKGTIPDADKEWINNYIYSKKTVNNEYTGLLKNKNLIVIQAESFCPQIIDEYLTPTLYYLKNNSLYFDNFYCPLYPSNTCDTEFIVQTSLVPSIEYGTTSKDFSKNDFKCSLANKLKENDYSVNSYHSFNKEFYNRSEFHESLGFEYLFDFKDMSLYKPEYYVDYYDWIDDKELIKGAMLNTDTSKKFYDLIVTASGHLPYMDLRPELYEFQGKANEYLKADPETAYYFASQMKLDEAMKYLIDYLNDNDLMDDTVIVLYGDHYPYGVSDITHEYLFSGLQNEYEIYKTPLFIINPGLPNRNIIKLCSSFDLYPTLANLFDLSINNSFYVGNDIFSNDECYVRFSDGSILTKDYYYSADQSKSEELSTEKNKEILLNSELMHYSQLFLLYDFYNTQK